MFGLRVAVLVVFAILSGQVCLAQNPVQIENAKAGTSGWQLANPATNREIEGYASLTSVNIGGSIDFAVSTSDSTFNIEVFRTGWYGGVGARLQTTIANLPGHVQVVPSPDPITGLLDCNWPSSYTLTIPTTWVSGIYLARLTGNQTGKQSYVYFVVRDDNRTSDIVYQAPVTTYEAYNFWPAGAQGKSLYSWAPGGRAWKVSFNRPFVLGDSYSSTTTGAATGVGAGEYLTNLQPGPVQGYPIPAAAFEYNMVRWLERNGYDVTYITNIDLHENASLLTKHKAYLSVGHNEYWSMPMRQNLQNALANGLSLGFFSSNTIYWQVRLEPSISGAADRTLVCYKYDAQADDPDYQTNPQLTTTTWRGLGMDEAALVGTEYFGDPVESDIIVSNASHFLMAGTGLHNGDHLPGLLGYEVDMMVSGISPANTDVLTSTPAGQVTDVDSPAGYSCGTQVCNSNATWYSAGKGFVFASGSMQWSWGLDDYNSPSLRNAYSSSAAQQIAKNVLSAFITPVTITTTSLPAGTQNQSYGPVQMGVTGGGPPYTWSATGLPAGLSLSAAGVLSGTPTGTGTSTVSFTATDNASHAATVSLSLIIRAPVVISTTSLPAGTQSQSYGPVQMAVIGGLAPYTWSATGVPAGLSFSTAGVLSGTPTGSGTSTIAFSVTDSTSHTGTASLSLLIASNTSVTITTTSLPGGTQNQSYGPAQMAAIGGVPPYTWSATGVPAGLSLSTAGALSGTPTGSGTSTISITAKDSASHTGTASLSLIVAPPVTITTASLPAGTQGQSYAPVQMAASGGFAPYSWSATGLPAGMSLSAAGVLSGTPTGSGTSTVNFTATDNGSHTGTASLALTVAAQTYLSISGTITTTGGPVAGVLVTLNPGGLTTQTDTTGNYAFTNLLPGSYTVMPSLVGYTFTPSSLAFTNVSTSQTANFSAVAVPARVVSVDFVGAGTAMASTETAGVIAKTNWNDAIGNTSSAAMHLVDETGAWAGGLATWQSDDSWLLPTSGTAGNLRMMQGFLDDGNQNPVTVSISGLPASSSGYDVYVYSDGDNASYTRVCSMALSGAGLTTSSINVQDNGNTNFNGTFQQATSATGWKGNYVKFSGVNATAFTVTATPVSTSGGGLRAPINGIQVVPSVPSVTITTASLPGGTQNQSYGPVQMAASGGVAPYTWSATGVPAGLTLSAAGVLSGTPTASGSSTIAFTVTDSAAHTATASLSLTVAAGLTITTASLPGGTQNQSYGPVQMAASGGVAPYTWTATGVPAGLTLSAAGVLSGTPTAAGSSTIAFTVTDSAAHTATASLSLTVAAGLTITTASLPRGTQNQSYGPVQMAASGGVAPYTWSATGVPAGLTLSAAGVLSGTPTASGSSTIAFTVTDSAAHTATASLALTVAAGLIITTASLPGGTQNQSYGPVQMAASGGVAPYTWTATGVPAGLTLSAAGVLSGTPTAAGSSTIAFTVTDSAAHTGTASLSLTVVAGLTITTASLPGGTQNQSYGPVQMAASGGVAPYTWTATGVPAGLTLSAAGVLSGTPTSAGTSTIAFTVTDSAAHTATASLALTVAAGLTITTASLPGGTQNQSYGPVQMAASGGVTPYTWTATGVPAGLTLSAAGVLSGTPTASGTSTIAFTVTDSAAHTATASLALTVVAGLTITTASLPGGTQNQGYGPVQMAASGGVAPYTWTATGVPAGLTLSAAGVLSGTPTASGSSTISFTVTDSASHTATETLSLKVRHR